MSNPAGGLRFEPPSDEFYAFDPDDNGMLPLDAGERICPPPERRGGRLGALLLVAVLLAGGWWLANADAERLAWLGARFADLAALARPPHTGTEVEPSSIARSDDAPMDGMHADAPPMMIPDVPETPNAIPVEVAVQTDDASASDAAAIETGALPESPSEAAASEPLPPPTVDPADPYQRRAAEVGLHPGLSRVVLARLSDTDYRNARYAIDTAIAKTPDTKEFVWPQQRKPERALFKVHFVSGAAPSCRRYVVTVVKDRWSTTAMPMERCGAALAAAKTAR